MSTRDDIEAFLDEYQATLSAFDAERTAALWGTPGTVVGDEFVGALHTHDEMARGLAQAHPMYQLLGLARVDHTLLDFVELTPVLVRGRVRWHFYDADDALLTDSDYEYVLRRADEGWRIHVAVAIDEAKNLARVAAERGIRLPGV